VPRARRALQAKTSYRTPHDKRGGQAGAAADAGADAKGGRDKDPSAG